MHNVSLAKDLYAFDARALDHPSVPATNRSAATWSEPASVVPLPVTHRHSARPAWLRPVEDLEELEVSYDPERRIVWQFMTPTSRPSFTLSLLASIDTAFDAIEQGRDAVQFLVFGSRMPGIFNLGGDLPRFVQLIEGGDREGLRRYAHSCINVVYRSSINHGLPLCTIALVQGDALGGGFEAALAHSVIIAERQAKFGLPETLFNLFPGMGAYSFLSRRLDAIQAERMILSGRTYTADELHEMGLVDMVVDDGEGIAGVHRFIAQFQRAQRARSAMLQARRVVNPVTREELLSVADLWVDTALTLSASDLRRMRHLATAQDRRWANMQKV